MSTASPENQIHLSEGLIHKSGPTSPPELAQMTNVANVLDLHKDFETKIYDKNTNTVYVYSNASKMDETTAAASSTSPELHQVVINQPPSDLSMDNGLKNANESFELMQENGVMLQRIVNDHLVEGRLVQTVSDGRGGEQQILTKINPGDDSLFRLIESNQLVSKLVGENQQIISRDIINGEHHIITRNENGEHILTRIVNTGSMDHGKMNGELFNATLGSLPTKGDDPKSQQTQIIYTSQSHETNGGVIKSHPQPYDNLNPDVQKQIDLIYEDGNKTVIYTAAGNAIASNPESPSDGEPKGLELYSSGECLNGTQVIVQGNLQYTPQIQPDGSTVYVVSELVSGDLNGQG
ncbi:CLUMA_CG021438, isoform A [Clunio marinus]|uniref:CLUMA_CG021438, isoform A n=1 Tax=Clunio marinus TaxID=568069 RepID=A0A1J1J9A3_9DIPT|nr:CLUMA_CG021438, isoform A [Clunio marinus]